MYSSLAQAISKTRGWVVILFLSFVLMLLAGMFVVATHSAASGKVFVFFIFLLLVIGVFFLLKSIMPREEKGPLLLTEEED